MAQIVTRYLVVILMVSLGFFGVGALASAPELRDPMQSAPLAIQKFREAKWAAKSAQPNVVPAKVE